MYEVNFNLYNYNMARWNCSFHEQDGETALMIATGMRHDECVSILIANGADVTMAMEVVARCFCVSSFDISLPLFFDLHRKETALLIALRRPVHVHVGYASMFVAQGADVNVTVRAARYLRLVCCCD